MIHSERKSTKLGKRILALFISVFLLAIQIAFFFFSFVSIYSLQWLYITVEVFGILIVLVIYRDVQSSSSYKLTWTILILVLPIIGTVFYLFVKNSQNFPKRRIKKIEKALYSKIEENQVVADISNPSTLKIASFIKRDTKYNVYNNSKAIFYNDAKEHFVDMFEAIRNAKKYIFLEYFIVSKGKLLNELYEILKEKSEEGVEIKFLYDDVGSVGVFGRKEKRMFSQLRNLQLYSFAPLGFNLNPVMNYRDHRKICVVDGEVGFVGGANLADEYVHYIERFGHWRDNGVKIIGEACDNLLRLFIENWYLSTTRVLEFSDYKVENQKFALNNVVIPFGDGPMDTKNTYYDLFYTMFQTANRYIYISTPYFIIDDMMIKGLVMACKMGVDVKILIPGIPDKKTAYYFTLAHLGEILAAGGKVYKYNGFNHAKNIIVDDKYGFCGTVNLDYRSLFLHYECGVLLMDDSEIEKMRKDFEECISLSEELTFESWKKRNIFSRIFAFIFRVFSPLF